MKLYNVYFESDFFNHFLIIALAKRQERDVKSILFSIPSKKSPVILCLPNDLCLKINKPEADSYVTITTFSITQHQHFFFVSIPKKIQFNFEKQQNLIKYYQNETRDSIISTQNPVISC